jgi:hypothetical protein
MLTGKRRFEGGETVSHTLADVSRGPIDFDKLPKKTRRVIRDLPRRCLGRDVKNRLRDVGERFARQASPGRSGGHGESKRFLIAKPFRPASVAPVIGSHPLKALYR